MFAVNGIADGFIPVKVEVTVKENYNEINGNSSTADFSCTDLDAASGDNTVIAFNILSEKSDIDGYIGFADSETEVDSFTSCPIALRLSTEGRIFYQTGTDEFSRSNAFYSKNEAYNIKITVDFNEQTYSAYMSQLGSDYGLVICEKVPFAVECSSIGKYCARGGSETTSAGQFLVSDMTYKQAETLTFIRSYKGEDEKKHIAFLANESGESTLYFVLHNADGTLEDVEMKTLKYQKGDIAEAVFEDGADYKLISLNEQMKPDFNALGLRENNERGFVSCFMGSFGFYNNPYNEWLTDNDPGVVQINLIELYSDRIVVTTKNYGEYSGTEREPEPFVWIRENGDMTQTDTPIKRIMVFGDYQICEDLLLKDEDPVRPVLKRICEDFASNNTKIDAVMIGGDLTYDNYITKERWAFVTESVLGYISDNLTPDIYIIAGNHDYHAGVRDKYNSADFYNTYMKDNMGSLEDNDNGYFEEAAYFDSEALIAFCYEQDGVYFMGISTSPDMVRGSLQHTNYCYTDGAMRWIKRKLAEIGKDKTVFLTGHYPLADSNNVIKSSKGALVETSDEFTEILSEYPNLMYLYGHDHGSDFAYIDSKTAERVTCYDSEGYKIK